MDEQSAKALLEKYQADKCTPEERALVESWFLEVTGNLPDPPSDGENEKVKADVWAYINQNITLPQQVMPLRRLWLRIAAAASIILLLSAGTYFILYKKMPQQTAQSDPEQLAPLQNGVTLALGNGQKVLLDTKHNGHLMQAEGALITQHGNLLDYRENTVDSIGRQNTLTNNSSGKFSVTLSDGTEATLDVGSSLTYPEAFTGNIRIVRMTGQAYFKVRHLTGRRFIVKIRNQQTEDIGTEFNINGYDDDDVIRTTLIEGSVKVNERLLKPGQEALLNSSTLEVRPADMESVTAWLQGKLVFEKEPLENIMRRVARIYGVQVIYQDEEVKRYTYFGSVNYSKKLASVLNFFRKAGRVDFAVEGKKVSIFKAGRKNN